ncbi:MAG: LysR family transcriptional regulator [Proteobacteria bacterium]|nr:LysR family transcriptional regulator [Pseudomonadota bacterium]
MNIASVNLNLLVSLDALLRERSVSRAAQRLGVTQSAMSHTLRQLRDLFEDPLLVRAGRRMVPTPRADELQPQLQAGLASLGEVLGRQGRFDPSRFTGRFTLATQDGVLAAIGAHLVPKLRREAPRAEFSVVPSPDDLAGALESGAIDVATAPPVDIPAGLVSGEVDNATTWSVVCCPDHPLDALDLDAYCHHPHAMVSVTGKGPGIVDHMLAPHGRTRWVSVRVPFLLVLPHVMQGTDLLATVVTPAANHFETQGLLRSFPCPIPMPKAGMQILWHERFDADPAHRWFRERVLDAMRLADEL